MAKYFSNYQRYQYQILKTKFQDLNQDCLKILRPYIFDNFQEIGHQRASWTDRVESGRFIVLNLLTGLKILIKIYFNFFRHFYRF